nr:calcium-activated chloride channel regulator 2-like [Penaeus vannamei]
MTTWWSRLTRIYRRPGVTASSSGYRYVMGRASSQLYLATGSRAFFRSVAVVIPASWSSSRCPRTLNFTASPPISPAFIVSQPHPVYAHAPWTLQVGGCGQPGRNIFFTPRYLAETNYTEALGDPGRVVVHEWAKYRWGVYEEFGHPEDPLYPAFHRTPTNPHTPTGCSNVPVQGSMASCDNPRDPACRFSPSYNNNDGVTSSLMYMHHLPHVTHFCSNATHDTTAPNRQKRPLPPPLRAGRLPDTSDFADRKVGEFLSTPPGDNTRDVTPKFTFIQPVPTRYVIVVEDTAIMNIQTPFLHVRSSAQHNLQGQRKCTDSGKLLLKQEGLDVIITNLVRGNFSEISKDL